MRYSLFVYQKNFNAKTEQYHGKLKNEFKRDFEPIAQYRYTPNTSKTFKNVLLKSVLDCDK